MSLHRAATAWLNEHWPDARCLICGADNWSIQYELLELNSAAPVRNLRRSVPYLVVECLSCGHASLFNASIAGLDAIASAEAAVAATPPGSAG